MRPACRPKCAQPAAPRTQPAALNASSLPFCTPSLPPYAPQVAFDLGQCLLHRRYSYRGVVVGFDRTCQQSEAWMRSMNVDTLKHGRNQPFYHVLPDTRDRPGAQLTYVAQVCARVCVWVLCGAWRVDRALHVHAHRMHTARTPHAHDAHAPSSPPTLLSPTRRRRTSSPTRRRSRCSTRWSTRCSKASTWRGGASCPTRSCASSTRHRRPNDEGGGSAVDG